MVGQYVPPKGPTQMWFIAHTGTPGCEKVISVDFDKCCCELPEQDTLLEAEFEFLSMPLCTDPLLAKVIATPLSAPVQTLEWLPVVALPAAPQAPVETTPAPPPPSPIRVVQDPLPPPPSPLVSRSVSPASTEPERAKTPSPAKRKHHTLLTDGIICKWVDVHGPTWRDLARSMGGRADGWSDDVVRNRYIRIVEELKGTPYVRRKRKVDFKKPEMAIEKWTEEEDVLLCTLLKEASLSRKRGGVPWQQVARRFGGLRTQQAIRNRASRLGLREDTQYVMETN